MPNKKIFITYIIFSLIILMIMNGCSSKPKPIVSAENQVPSWFLNPPQTDNTYMYGVAIANSRQGAIKKALDDMISKLSINIKSTYNSKVQQNNYYTDTNISNNIKTTISLIKINNYKVLRTKLIGYNKFAILIQTNKRKFVHGLIVNLNNMRKRINLRYSLLKHQNVIMRYHALKQLTKNAKKMQHTLQIIDELTHNQKFDKLLYLADIIRVEQRFLTLKNKLTFYIKPNKNSSLFIEAMKDFLTKHNFTVFNKKNKNSINLHIKVNDNIYKNKYMNIITIYVKIQIFNNALHVGGNTFTFKQRYTNSKQKAYQAAVLDFKKELMSKTINEALDINL